MGFLELARQKVKELELDKKREITPEPQEVAPSDPLQVEDFKKQNIAVRIRSSVVNDDFWVVSNEEVKKHLKAEGLVCYLPEEILHMRNLPPEGIKTLHAIKKEFGGKTRIIQSGKSPLK